MKHNAEQFELPVTVEEPRQHHKYGMSKLDYLEGCPGFKGNEGTNQAAEDGTRLHDIMDQVIALTLAPDPATSEWKRRRTAAQALASILNHEAVTDEEGYWLEYCCKELDYWLARAPRKGDILHEEKIAITRPDGTELNHGHYDVLIFLSDTAAVLLDYKFGWNPVRPAAVNLQGRGYATGVMQKYPSLTITGVVFIQPKLHQVTRCNYKRAELPDMYHKISEVIRRAEAPEKTLCPSTYCDYCVHAQNGCTALVQDAARAVQIHEGLPMPSTFTGLQINTPEECAKALYVIDRLDVLIQASGLKDRAKQFAKANGGTISCEISPGKVVTYDLKSRAMPRSANSPNLIAEALKEVLTPEQVLGACDPKITRLEEIFADEFVAQRKKAADDFLEDAEERIDVETRDGVEPEWAETVREEAKAEAKTIRTSRKQAREILASILSAEGLLSAPEGSVEYLKGRVETKTKQIENTK